MVRKTIVCILRMLRLDGIVYRIATRRAFRRHWESVDLTLDELSRCGLCIAADFRSFDSIAQVGRDFVDALGCTDISFELLDLNTRYSAAANSPLPSESEYLKKCSKKISKGNVLCFINREMFVDPRLTIATTPFWEFESGMLEFSPHIFDGISHVVAFSDFCYDYFTRINPKGVSMHKVRYPYVGQWHSVTAREVIREKFKIPQMAFVVFFHYNFGSCSARKNPEGALAAFRLAFAENPRACLVLKVAGATKDSVEYRELLEKVMPFGERVIVINERISHQEMLDLIASADVYMSLHRGEGFGIGMLEAMAIGTPVICTAYGGNLEFCKRDTSFLVGYKMVPNVIEDFFYKGVVKWPEPNIAEAATYLRSIYSNPDLGRSRAAAASRFLENYFNVTNFKCDVQRLIDEMNEGCSVGG